MRKIPFFLILGNLIIFFGFYSLAFSEAPPPQTAPAYEPQKILIQFPPDLNIHTELQAQEILENNLKKLNYLPAILNIKKISDQSGRGPIFSFRLENLPGLDIPQLARELKRLAQDEMIAASANWKGKVNGLVLPSGLNETNSPGLVDNPNDPFFCQRRVLGAKLQGSIRIIDA